MSALIEVQGSEAEAAEAVSDVKAASSTKLKTNLPPVEQTALMLTEWSGRISLKGMKTEKLPVEKEPRPSKHNEILNVCRFNALLWDGRRLCSCTSAEV